MQNIAVFYGGKSVEHDISVITAVQTMQNLNRQKYNIIPVYQTKNCEFVCLKDYLSLKAYTNKLNNFKKVVFNFGKGTITLKGLISKTLKIDCAINCCHGNSGEDGTITAICNLCNIPLTSCSILASSICMDKIIMKDIFVANNIPCVDYVGLTKYEYNQNPDRCIKQITKKLGFPIIVKPSNLGSSIGIEKANNTEELEYALDVAFTYDTRVIAEKCLEDFKEVNISALGNYECELSEIEQPVNWQDFLNFEDKYISSGTNKKILNPKLDKNVKKQLHSLAKTIFKVFDLSGVIRIDFMVKENSVYVNEINTVPGSLAFYLWKPKDIDFFELIDRLIELAKQKHKENSLNNYTYKTDILNTFSENKGNKYSK